MTTVPMVEVTRASMPVENVYVGGTATTNYSDSTPSWHKPQPPTRKISKISSIDVPKTKTGMLGSAANLINAILGACMIGVPYAIKETGIVMGVVLLIIVSQLTHKSLRMIIELATYHPKLKNLGVLTFEDLMTIPFGETGRNFILCSMFILSYGAMVAYLLIIKDNISDLLGLGDTFIERECVMLLSSFMIVLPLCFCRDISELACTSFISVMADVVLVVIVCIFAPVKETVAEAGGIKQVLQDNWVNSGLFIGLGVISDALVCQHSCFLISGTLENHSASNWAKVTGLSLVVATTMNLAFGVVGFLGFLDQTEGDVLRNFEQGTVVNAPRVLISVTTFLAYPIELFVVRHVLAQLFFKGTLENHYVDEYGNVHSERKLCGMIGRREYVTLGLYALSVIPAMLIDDLGPILSLTGSLGASGIAYIAPGLVYIGLNGEDFLAWVNPNIKYESCRDGIDDDYHYPTESGQGSKFEIQLQQIKQAKKPWWWYLIGMPIWVTVAKTGAKGCNEFLLMLDSEIGRPVGDLTSEDDLEVIRPTKYDHVISIVLVVFGVVAAVAGVFSNICVQVMKLIYVY